MSQRECPHMPSSFKSRVFISSSVRLKSKTFVLDVMWYTFVLLSKGTQPFWSEYRIRTWCGVLLYFTARDTRSKSRIIAFPVIEQYASITTP